MVVVIGDIHGCFNTLKKLYAIILKKYPDIPVYAVGDLVDRGKFSYEVIEFVRKNKINFTAGTIEASSRSVASAVPGGPPAVMKNGSARRGGTVVYAPVPEALDLPYSPPPEQRAVQQAAPPAAAMPDADEVAARGGVAALHLDLHVYATQPQQRFVFVNSRKYKEGDTLAEGPVVEQITRWSRAECPGQPFQAVQRLN